MHPKPVAIPARGFRYLLDPEVKVGGSPFPVPCVACGETRPCFALVDIHDDGSWDQHYVCESCLRAGRLVERGLRINEVEPEQLAGQLALVGPALLRMEQERLAGDRTREVEYATPRPPIFQPFCWPAHCGDGYGFVKRVQKTDLHSLSPDGDGWRFFSEHLQREAWTDDEWVAQIWQGGFAPQGFVNVYLWRCLHCGQHLLTYDHD